MKHNAEIVRKFCLRIVGKVLIGYKSLQIEGNVTKSAMENHFLEFLACYLLFFVVTGLPSAIQYPKDRPMPTYLTQRPTREPWNQITARQKNKTQIKEMQISPTLIPKRLQTPYDFTNQFYIENEENINTNINENKPNFRKTKTKTDSNQIEFGTHYILFRNILSNEMIKDILNTPKHCRDNDEREHHRDFGYYNNDGDNDSGNNESEFYSPHPLHNNSNINSDGESYGTGHTVVYLNDCFDSKMYNYFKNIIIAGLNLFQNHTIEYDNTQNINKIFDYFLIPHSKKRKKTFDDDNYNYKSQKFRFRFQSKNNNHIALQSRLFQSLNYSYSYSYSNSQTAFTADNITNEIFESASNECPNDNYDVDSIDPFFWQFEEMVLNKRRNDAISSNMNMNMNMSSNSNYKLFYDSDTCDIIEGPHYIQNLSHLSMVSYYGWKHDWKEIIDNCETMESRVIEYIRYYTSGALGWHTDSESMITMVAGMSDYNSNYNSNDNLSLIDDINTTDADADTDADRYNGGVLEMRTNMLDKDVERVLLTKGDLIIFPSYTEHRVTPIKSGQRKVLCIEWWHNRSRNRFIGRHSPAQFDQMEDKRLRVVESRKNRIEKFENRKKSMKSITNWVSTVLAILFLIFLIVCCS